MKPKPLSPMAREIRAIETDALSRFARWLPMQGARLVNETGETISLKGAAKLVERFLEEPKR